MIVGGFYTPVGRHRRLAALRDDHARARAGERRAERVREHRGARHRRRARAASPGSAPRAATSRRRSIVVCCGVWSTEDRAHGGRVDPADAGGAPDDRRRPGAALQGHEGRDRVPDRPRHGHEHVRAPGRERARDRLVRAPPDPSRPRGDPVERRGGAVADRVPVHGEGLPAADGGRARADPRGAERRVGRHQVRDQRHPLADARRPAAARRDAGGQGAVVGSGGVGEGGAGRRPGRRRVDDARRVRDRPPVVRHRALLRAPALERSTCKARAAEGFNKTYGIVHPAEQWESNRRVRLSPFYERERELGAVFFEAAAGSARSGTSRTRSCSTSTATASTAARRSGSRAGGRRSSTPSIWRCATAPRCST